MVWVRRLAGIMLAAAVATACSAKHYRKSADKEVYGILQHYDALVFGHTNEFTINTRYSSRKPQDIPPNEIIQDRATSNQLVINLDKALELGVANSRNYQSQKEQLYLTALSLTGVRYEFTPQFYANSVGQIAGSPSTSERGSIGTSIGLNQFLKTGGKLSVALANDLVRYFTGKPQGAARNTAIDIISVELSQPLMRGFGANNPLVEQLTQAERNVVYAIRTYSKFQQTFAIETVTEYFDLVTRKDIVRNNFRNYTNRVETTRYLEARSVDRERVSSVDDARNAELNARREYINSLANYLTAVDTFKLRLGLPISEQLYLEDKDLRDLIDAGLPEVDVDRNAAFQIALNKQMDILNAIDQFEDSKRKVRVAADRLRAEVNLFSTAELQSAAPDDYANFDPNKVRYAAGVRINFPIDRLRERNEYRASLINFESELRSLEQTLDEYRDRIDRGLRSIEQARLNYLNSVEALKVASRRVDNNSMLLEAGRATIRDVREAQDQLILAENELAISYAGYLAARLNLLLNIGVVDIRPERFWLADPLKPMLTPEQRTIPMLRMPNDQVVPPEHFLDPAT